MEFILGIIAAAISFALVGILRRPIVNMFQDLAVFLAVTFNRAIWKISPKIASDVATGIMDTLFKNTQTWSAIVNKYMELTFPEVKGIKAEELVTPESAQDALTYRIVEGWYKKMIDTIAPQSEITPEKGVENAVNFFRTNLTFQLNAWLLHWISDTFSLGSMKSFKDLPK